MVWYFYGIVLYRPTHTHANTHSHTHTHTHAHTHTYTHTHTHTHTHTLAMELGEYVEAFRANKIDGELLSELQDSDLIQV